MSGQTCPDISISTGHVDYADKFGGGGTITTTYLCGPIEGRPIEDARTWRERAKDVLRDAGFTMLDSLEWNLTGGALVAKCFEAVDEADILLVESNTPGVAYIGTAMEIREASLKPGRVIVVWGSQNRRNPFMRAHVLAWYDDLETALAYIVGRSWKKG